MDKDNFTSLLIQLGHFLLTELLQPLLRQATAASGGGGARVVTVSSGAYVAGKMNWADLNFRHTPYNAFDAYSQSKLANILFTRELARRTAGTGN